MLRLTSSGDKQSDVIIATMKYFKWTKAVMLTSSDDYGKIVRILDITLIYTATNARR